MPMPVNLIVTIDVEEDNWGCFDASQPTLENIKMIPQLQDFFDRYGIKPTYLVTYPVVSSRWAVDILSEIMHAGKCEIGTHLHPWNTPPEMPQDPTATTNFGSGICS